MKVLSNHGYKIIKKEYSSTLIKEIKDELTVKPRTFTKTKQNEHKFPVFLESPKKLYLPRFYALDKLGVPSIKQLA